MPWLSSICCRPGVAPPRWVHALCVNSHCLVRIGLSVSNRKPALCSGPAAAHRPPGVASGFDAASTTSWLKCAASAGLRAASCVSIAACASLAAPKSLRAASVTHAPSWRVSTYPVRGSVAREINSAACACAPAERASGGEALLLTRLWVRSGMTAPEGSMRSATRSSSPLKSIDRRDASPDHNQLGTTLTGDAPMRRGFMHDREQALAAGQRFPALQRLQQFALDRLQARLQRGHTLTLLGVQLATGQEL